MAMNKNRTFTEQEIAEEIIAQQEAAGAQLSDPNELTIVSFSYAALAVFLGIDLSAYIEEHEAQETGKEKD